MKYVLTEDAKKTVESNMGLVIFVVNEYIRIPNYSFPDVDYDDLISIGYMGLCKAVINYSSGSKVAFSTYATTAIIRTIHREFLGRYRKRRGNGAISISYDAPTEDGRNALEVLRSVNDKVSVEKEVLDRIAYEPIWKYVPIYCAIQRMGITEREYAKKIGAKYKTVNTQKKRQFAKAREALRDLGLIDGEYII